MELQTHYQRLNGVIRAKQAHQNVTLRFIAGPDDELPSKTNPLDYTPEEVDDMFTLGIYDAKKAIEHVETILNGLQPINFNDYLKKMDEIDVNTKAKKGKQSTNNQQ